MHRGREIRCKLINDDYEEVRERGVNLFVSFCRFHAEQQIISSRMKEVKKLQQSFTFLLLIHIYFMDFTKWAMNIIYLQIGQVSIKSVFSCMPHEVNRAVKEYVSISGNCN